MTGKPVVPREQARRDVQAAIDHFLAAGSFETASAFVEALAEAYEHVGRHPATGAPRYARAARRLRAGPRPPVRGAHRAAVIAA